MPQDKRPPDQLTRRQLHARIVRESLRLIGELNQLITDTLSYNDTPQMQGQRPFGVEDLRVQRHDLIGQLNQFLKENPV